MHACRSTLEDPTTVYVAALGHLWNANPERGLYKTTDGGKTWQRILFVDDNTGCSAVAIDPSQPRTIFASMWQYRRKAWAFESGGPGSGLYKSVDGGQNWVKLTGDPKSGLPGGNLGRIAVVFAPSDSKIVYTTIEAKDGGLFRSADGGATWERRNTGADVTIRPFYFSALFVDPRNPDRVYKPGYTLISSEDGGKSFTAIGGRAHGDHHAFWIRPDNSETIYTGTDGGLFVSEDRGSSWRMVGNLPLSQYYRVSYDMATPYNVYGGLQDNACWYGPTSTGGGIQNRHWKNLCGGDGFWMFEDPTDPEYAYVEVQGGEADRVNKRTLERYSIKPREAAGEAKYRFNWNTPMRPSPNDPKTVYMGAQYLFRSRDNGKSWEKISPDLTTNDPAKQQQEESGGVTIDNSSAETHTTIYAVAESPKTAGLIWVGTDDGNLQLTQDGGKTWTNVAANVSGVPKGTWVSWIEPSPFAAGTAFVTFDGHTTGDMRTYVARTTDFGRTWTMLASPALRGFAHVIRQDLINADLLFLGTEAGLFISLDGGRGWARYKGGDFPPVPVRDIAIHPREDDLIVATHGRGIWIIDDLTPMRSLTPEVLNSNFAFLPTKPGVLTNQGSDGWMEGDAGFTGPEPAGGGPIAYYQKKRHLMGDFNIEVLDASGKSIWTEGGNKRRGATRMQWNMYLPGPKSPAGGGDMTTMFRTAVGPRVTEGTYTVRATKGKETYTTTLKIVPDPDTKFTAADRKLQFDTALRIGQMLESMKGTVDRIVALRDQAGARAKETKDAKLAGALNGFAADLEKERNKYVPIKSTGGITGEERLREHLGSVYQSVIGSSGPPNRAWLDRIDALQKEITTANRETDALIEKQLAKLNPKLKSAKLNLLEAPAS